MIDRRRFAMCFVVGLLIIFATACSGSSENKEDMSASKLEADTTGMMTTDNVTTDQVTDMGTRPMEIVSVYQGNEDATGLLQAMDAVEELTAQSMVDKLIEYHVLGEGTVVLNFTVTDGVGYLDLSAVPVTGTTGEVLMLAAIGNTFTENFNLEKLKLLINGENYSSGHMEQEDEDYLKYNKSYKNLM